MVAKHIRGDIRREIELCTDLGTPQNLMLVVFYVISLLNVHFLYYQPLVKQLTCIFGYLMMALPQHARCLRPLVQLLCMHITFYDGGILQNYKCLTKGRALQEETSQIGCFVNLPMVFDISNDFFWDIFRQKSYHNLPLPSWTSLIFLQMRAVSL